VSIVRAGQLGLGQVLVGESAQAVKLRKAAREFEAMLLSSWWKSMKESGLPGGEDDSDPGKDTLDQLGMQAMSAAVAKGGGIGIAAMLVKSLLTNVVTANGTSREGQAATGADVSNAGGAGNSMVSSD